MLPKANMINANYITKVLIPELLHTNHGYDIVRYDEANYIDFFDNGTYIMFSGTDVFVSPCDEFGVLSKENGKSKRYNNIIKPNIFSTLYKKSRVIKTEDIMNHLEEIRWS